MVKGTMRTSNQVNENVRVDNASRHAELEADEQGVRFPDSTHALESRGLKINDRSYSE